MNINEQNSERNKIDKIYSKERIEELRNRLQAIEWDMKQGTFSKDKIPYYKKSLQEYEEIIEKTRKSLEEE